MAIVIAGGSVTLNGEDEEPEMVLKSTCGVCGGAGLYLGVCCFACGGGT
jgi:hypothetical protein